MIEEIDDSDGGDGKKKEYEEVDIDLKLLEKAKKLAGSADMALRGMNKEHATYIVTKSIEKIPEKLRRRDMRTYLGENDNKSSFTSGNGDATRIDQHGAGSKSSLQGISAHFMTSSTKGAKQSLTGVPGIDTSLYENVQIKSIFPHSMWLSMGTFHICTSSHVPHVMIEAETSVDFVIIYGIGIHSVRIVTSSSEEMSRDQDFFVESTGEGMIPKIEAPLQSPSRKFTLYIVKRKEMFPCIYKLDTLSSVRSSTLSTPVKGRSPENFNDIGRVGGSVMIQNNSSRPLSGRVQKPATSRLQKAHIHGSAAAERMSKNESKLHEGSDNRVYNTQGHNFDS